MYLNKNKHIISIALFLSSVMSLIAQAVNTVLRLMINHKYADRPDMLNTYIYHLQHIVAYVEIFLIAVIFALALRKLHKLGKMFDEDEEREIAKLQREYNVGGVSSINVGEMTQLTLIWAVILIGARIVYEILSGLYTRFIEQLFLINDIAESNVGEAVVSIYNNTHAFKYQGMFIAISIGFFVTGVFLKDKFLQIFSGIMATLFVIASYASNMTSITALGRTVGIVWTSVFFHIFQTIGLMFLAFYLAKRHRGM